RQRACVNKQTMLTACHITSWGSERSRGSSVSLASVQIKSLGATTTSLRRRSNSSPVGSGSGPPSTSGYARIPRDLAGGRNASVSTTASQLFDTPHCVQKARRHAEPGNLWAADSTQLQRVPANRSQ